LQVGKRWESPGSEAVELILEEHDLLFLLLDDIQQFALVRDVLDLLLGVAVSTLRRVRLETLDLHALLDVVLENARLVLKLLVLHLLLLDLLSEFGLHVLDCFDPLLRVLLKLGGLGVEALLVIFLLLDVLALDDLLSLLGHSVELDVHGTLGEVDNLKLESLILALNLLQLD